ncbi:MAG: 16S rRNA (uracil(1498)-N(3))-methyltransferase [Ruminococcaceae bacterium]|nr:16S rRNA (uracil(1498)-N(3))-methyltransferase [Oscillospiraceae bacterium]
MIERALYVTMVQDRRGGKPMARFFVAPEELNGPQILLTGENAQHARVLRLKAGEEVLACDGQGMECLCTVESVSAGEVILGVLERRSSRNEAAVKVSIYMAFPKADKLEHVIQKATELGAYEIVAFPSGRCISRPDDKSLKKKLERWQKIAASAAEQSGRGVIPEVIALPSFTAALERAGKADKALMFYENEHATTLRMALESGSFETVSLLTGPEGGLEEKEVEQARNAGLQVCTLGSRILRCETAPLCALSAVMYAAGEF